MMNNVLTKFLIDSGSSVDVLPLRLTTDKDTLIPTNKTIKAYNNQTINVLGQITKTLKNPQTNQLFDTNFLVVNTTLPPILGKSTSENIGILKIDYNNFEHVHSLHSTEDILANFSDVFESSVGCLPNPVKLSVKENSTPNYTKPTRLPINLMSKVKEEIDRLTSIKVLEPVSTPNEWSSRMVIATKKNGNLRICIDPKHLNSSLIKETFQLPTLEEILPELQKAKIFSKLDIKNAFWHCKLDPDSSDLTTMSTPFGQFKWNRLPFGLCVSSEVFQKNVTEALKNLKGTFYAIDDIIVTGCGDTPEQALQDHNANLKTLLLRCREQNIALNREKLELCKKQISFLGHIISANGLQPDPEKVKAIVNMKPPTDIKGVQRLIGFINYLSKFLPHLSTVIQPIRSLLLKQNEFHWGHSQEMAFKNVKHLITNAPVLAYFSSSKPCTIQCDSSNSGLGATLLQESKPIAYASRALTTTEQSYSQIEKETLAIVFALKKFHHYIFARKTTIHSDHKPLEAIHKKPLASMPRRLQGMMLRILEYDIEVVYKKGKEMYIADTLSRSHLPETNGHEEFEQVNYAQEASIKPERLIRFQSETDKDPQLSLLKSYITNGWPKPANVPITLKPYFNFRETLSINDGIIFKDHQIVTPPSCRLEMKHALHSSHRAADACIRRAHETIYWPNMNSEIRDFVNNCKACQIYKQRNPREPLIPHEIPTYAWEKVGLDIFSYSNMKYLIVVDYLTDYFEVERLPNETSEYVVKSLKQQFARYGIPEIVISDNGPCFASHFFKTFSETYDFQHILSSPHYPQSNGKAENAVKQAKNLLKKSTSSETDPYLGLLEIRNTPDPSTGLSPAQKFHCRQLRSTLPSCKKSLQKRSCEYSTIINNQNENASKQKHYYDRQTKNLRPFLPGTKIFVAPTSLGDKVWKPGTILESADDHNRSYRVHTTNGTLIRNRRQLRIRHIDDDLYGTDIDYPTNLEPHHSTQPPYQTPVPRNNFPPRPYPPHTHNPTPATPRPSQIPVRTSSYGRTIRPRTPYSP